MQRGRGWEAGLCGGRKSDRFGRAGEDWSLGVRVGMGWAELGKDPKRDTRVCTPDRLVGGAFVW